MSMNEINSSPWIFEWKHSKEKYAPGERGLVDLWLTNNSHTNLTVKELLLFIDWLPEGKCLRLGVSKVVSSKSRTYLGKIIYEITSDVVGLRSYQVGIETEEYGTRTAKPYGLVVVPATRYKAFLSRSLWDQDLAWGEQVRAMVEDWGFDCYTVGVEEDVSRPDTARVVRQRIVESDCLIAILSPRAKTVDGLWRTLEWGHGETGIAYGIDRPLVILVDERVTLKGLPDYLTRFGEYPIIKYSEEEGPEPLKLHFAQVLPKTREYIANSRRPNWIDILGKVVVAIGAAAIIGGVGYYIGRQDGST